MSVKIKTLLLYIVAIGLIFSASFKPAEASVFSYVFDGFIYNLNTIHNKITGGFCNDYNKNISNGKWEESDFKSRFASLFCEKIVFVPVKNNTVEKTVDEKLSLSTSTVAKIKIIEKVITNSTSTSPKPLKNTSDTEGLKISSNAIVYWTNIQRKDNSLPSLVENDELSKIAQMRVDDMFLNSYFQHVSPTGDSVSKIADRLGTKYIIIGENIALGNFDSSRALVYAWMNSPGHRANILNNDYTQIGVASTDGIYEGRNVTISAQVFDKPLSDCPSPNKSIKSQIDSYVKIKDNLKADINKIELELNSQELNTAEYNNKIQQFNSIIEIYNNLIIKIKELADIYNKSVEEFNNCIKIIQ